MFNNLGTHVINNPAGTYSFVGTLPTVLAEMVPADKNAILGCRSFEHNGQSMMWKWPVFETKQQAIDFAESKGVIITT